MFELKATKLSGCWEIVPRILRDDRGYFVKIFHYDFFEQHGLETNFKEEYHSLSYQGAIARTTSTAANYTIGVNPEEIAWG